MQEKSKADAFLAFQRYAGPAVLSRDCHPFFGLPRSPVDPFNAYKIIEQFPRKRANPEGLGESRTEAAPSLKAEPVSSPKGSGDQLQKPGNFALFKCRKADLSEDSGPSWSKCRLKRGRLPRVWSPWGGCSEV